MNWWQDPAQRREVAMNEQIQKDDVWEDGESYVGNKWGAPGYLEWMPEPKLITSKLYRRVYPKYDELIALRMEVMDLSDEVKHLENENQIYKNDLMETSADNMLLTEEVEILKNDLRRTQEALAHNQAWYFVLP